MQYEVTESRLVQFKTDDVVETTAVALDARLLQTLETKLAIKQLFSMQEKVISHLLHASEKGRAGDVVLSAPTGSGKTLAYALPIIHALLDRTIPKLRALVVVPTHDLASQVKQVFDSLCSGFGISVAVVSGANSVTLESSLLSKAEIVIATPGRLVDHIRNNDRFRLDAVKFLVLDESDRLLEESYQGWIDSLIPVVGIHRPSPASSGVHHKEYTCPTSGMLALAINPEVSARSFIHSTKPSEETVRKILVSATQTTNPKRLVKLGLKHPTIFEPETSTDVTAPEKTTLDEASTSTFSIPSSMTEKAWVLPYLQDKPMGLLKLLGWVHLEGSSRISNKTPNDQHQPGGTKLIFTKSVESAHRLCRLLELCSYMLKQDATVFEMSRDMSSKRRQFVLETVKNAIKSSANNDGRQLLVVCSDVLARGMDITNVDAVINYDAPIHIETYVHRAGRTARAGRTGAVTTLLVPKQAYHFRQMVQQADRGNKKVQLKRVNVIEEQRSAVSSQLSHALKALKRVLTREKLALLVPNESLPRYALFELCRQKREMEMDEADEDEEAESANEPEQKRQKKGKDLANDMFPTENTGDNGDEDDEFGDDSVTDLLFAQICRNYLQSCA